MQQLSVKSSCMNSWSGDPSLLHGDPSFILNTSADLGTNKHKIMVDISNAIAEILEKPLGYVCVAINDNMDMIWGGNKESCGLGTLTSLGKINLENNEKMQARLSGILNDYIPADRMYVTFVDVARENMGYNGKTFAR